MFLELHFLFLSLSTILLFTWFIVPYFYLTDFVMAQGLSETDASTIISTIGATNTVGMVRSIYAIRVVTVNAVRGERVFTVRTAKYVRRYD